MKSLQTSCLSFKAVLSLDPLAVPSSRVLAATPLSYQQLSNRLVQSARIGRRRTLITYCFIFMLGAVGFIHEFNVVFFIRPFWMKVLTTLADGLQSGLQLIYAGRFISGVGIGAISSVAPAFVSECSPKEVRGRITGLFGMT